MVRKRRSDDGDLVWSSDQGDLRKSEGPGGGRGGKAGTRSGKRGRGGRNTAETDAPSPAPAGTTIKVKRETSGRKGKTATTLTDIPLDATGTKALAKRLKQHCGVGGSSRGSSIELQGDHRDKVIAFLEKEGLRAVKAGG